MHENEHQPQVMHIEHHRPKRPKHEALRSILGTIVILLTAPILALLITAFVFQSYQVDGPSMEPTLWQNERLIVWKVGKTWSRISGDNYIPARGSVVVFVKNDSFDIATGQKRQLIKRVIGIPGDHVVVKDGTLRVYNSEHPNGYNPDDYLPEDITPKGEIIGEADIELDPGEIFVVGDHRDNSTDSRMFGAVSSKDIVGTLSMRIMPLGEAKKF